MGYFLEDNEPPMRWVALYVEPWFEGGEALTRNGPGAGRATDANPTGSRKLGADRADRFSRDGRQRLKAARKPATSH